MVHKSCIHQCWYGKLSHSLQGFLYIQPVVGLGIFFASTVVTMWPLHFRKKNNEQNQSIQVSKSTINWTSEKKQLWSQHFRHHLGVWNFFFSHFSSFNWCRWFWEVYLYLHPTAMGGLQVMRRAGAWSWNEGLDQKFAAILFIVTYLNRICFNNINWLVVEPIQLKNMSQHGFIFPK